MLGLLLHMVVEYVMKVKCRHKYVVPTNIITYKYVGNNKKKERGKRKKND